MLVSIIIFLGTFSFDFLTKYFAAKQLALYHSIPLIGDFLKLTYVQNQGAAFGILQGQQLFLKLVGFLALGFIIYLYFSEKSKNNVWNYGLALILGGTVGNLYNRITLGYVIDFIDFKYFPTFNIADVAINAGILLLIIQELKKKY
jgi:signal peptidase II